MSALAPHSLPVSPPFERSSRARTIELSEILRISELAATLRDSARNVLSLSTGEPDFPTPDHVVVAAHAAMLADQTRYTPTQGTLALRDAVAVDCERNDGYRPQHSEIWACRQCDHAFLCQFEPGIK